MMNTLYELQVGEIEQVAGGFCGDTDGSRPLIKLIPPRFWFYDDRPRCGNEPPPIPPRKEMFSPLGDFPGLRFPVLN